MRPGKQPPLAYRALLRLFPRTFREEFGDDMGRLFVERREEAGRFRLARARVWMEGIRDLCGHALAEQWQQQSPKRGSSVLERWLADLRGAFRGLRNAPGFTAASILTLALGLGAAAWAARLLANLLYEIGPSDTATFVATPVVLVTVAVIACAVPARRASRLDPVIVLRHD